MSAEALSATVERDTILDFTGYGIWILMNSTSFVQLHTFDVQAS